MAHRNSACIIAAVVRPTGRVDPARDGNEWPLPRRRISKRNTHPHPKIKHDTAGGGGLEDRLTSVTGGQVRAETDGFAAQVNPEVGRPVALLHRPAADAHRLGRRADASGREGRACEVRGDATPLLSRAHSSSSVGQISARRLGWKVDVSVSCC